jgi:hypothetical protein
MINFSQFGNDLYTGRRSIDFIGRQTSWYTFSGILIVLALVGMFARGLNFGIEFRGGSEFRLTGVSDTSNYEDKAKSAVSEAGMGGNVLASVIGGATVRVQTEAAGEHNEAAKAALAKAFNVDQTTVSASLIGPSWGVGEPEGDPSPHRLPAARGPRHGHLLPHLEDGRGRAWSPSSTTSSSRSGSTPSSGSRSPRRR